ncbi:MAG: hypothetical protein ACRDJG_03700 [Actinomycetota bacterium]
MEILDARGRNLEEVVLSLSREELGELMVGASQVDDGSSEHAVVRDRGGRAVALYLASDEPPPLARHTDWWLGPIILVAVLLIAIGAYTVARELVDLLF